MNSKILTNRLLKYFTREELASTLGVSAYAVYAWSKGIRSPRWLYIKEMQRLLLEREVKQ